MDHVVKIGQGKWIKPEFRIPMLVILFFAILQATSLPNEMPAIALIIVLNLGILMVWFPIKILSINTQTKSYKNEVNILNYRFGKDVRYDNLKLEIREIQKTYFIILTLDENVIPLFEETKAEEAKKKLALLSKRLTKT